MARLQLTNAQRAHPVPLARLRRVARCAAGRLGIRAAGEIAVTFIDSTRMRALNKRFLRHDRTTDVLSFRYNGAPGRLPARLSAAPTAQAGRAQAGPSGSSLAHGPVIGELLIDPGMARRYAAAHDVPYPTELARYVIHGLLHWLGHEDRTPLQQRKMRKLEDRLLARCDSRLRVLGSGLGDG